MICFHLSFEKERIPTNDPKTNINFWREKLQKNAERDRNNVNMLKAMGWKVRIVWLCFLKNKKKFKSIDYINEVVEWITDCIE
ncbi:MAG: hypothetical protein A3F40_01075 [Chlamydiae bacterium RIFCSPHIGHO2_12_FULL_27_8]|nr:MAG: hypothetical protein A3F40_01075 [Chlamydiae bacterium RIFCSPHIGHO2_12_FULL_27_8]